MQHLTPYAAAKVANKVLEAKGLTATITPQMMYSYAKNERIATVRFEGDKKVYFDGDAFKTWLDNYLKNGAPANKVNFDDLAKQFM